MLFMVILVGMGERMAERFLPIYLIAIGGSVLSIGLLNGLDNLLSALYAYPEGIWRPTRKALIMNLAPEDRKAGMFGLYTPSSLNSTGSEKLLTRFIKNAAIK